MKGEKLGTKEREVMKRIKFGIIIKKESQDRHSMEREKTIGIERVSQSSGYLGR